MKGQFVFPYFHDVSLDRKHQTSRGTAKTTQKVLPKSDSACSPYPHHFQNRNYLVSLLFTVLPLPKKLQEATWSSMNEFRFPRNNSKLLTFRRSQSLKRDHLKFHPRSKSTNQQIPFVKKTTFTSSSRPRGTPNLKV